MSVIAEQAVAAPIATPEAPALTVEQEIAAINAQVTEANGEGPASDQGIEQPVIEEFVEPAEDAAAAPAKEKPDETETDAEPDKKDEAIADVITFDPAAETPETYLEKKAAIEAQYELPDEIKSLVAYNEAKVVEAQAALAEIDAVGNKEAVVRLATAFDKVYDTEIVDGRPVNNVHPILDLLRTDYRSVYPQIAQEMFASDSIKYEGTSVFAEMLIDTLGPEKAAAIGAFAYQDMPLPVVPPELSLPQGVNPASKEAYFKLPEVKRFEIQSLVGNIATLEADLADASDYYKEEIQQQIGKSRELLKAELFAIDQIQGNYNATREREAAVQRQNQEAGQIFRSEVNTAYNTEIFTMAEDFAKNLAPKLTFADTDTQLSQARNVMSRVNNALGFIIKDNGSVSSDPMADHYAKQLAEEGLKFDFVKGRDLLQRHYQATEKLTLLKHQKADPLAVQKAERNKNNIMLDIKGEQRQLLGQLSAKYVKSNGNALEKQIEVIKGKKQIAKSVTNGKPVTTREGKPTLDSVDKEIAALNADARSRIKDGDDLYDEYVR